MAQPVCLGLLAVSSRLLPVTDHSLAIRERTTLGCQGAIGGGSLAVRDRAHRDLRTTGVRRGGESRQRTITQGNRLITLDRRQIASVGSGVTTRGRGNATRHGATSLPCAALAELTSELVHAGVCTTDETTVAGELVQIGGGLVAVRRRLVAVRSALIAVGPRLIGVSQRLIAFAEHLIVSEHRRETHVAPLLSSDSIERWSQTMARRLRGHDVHS